jgi:hypothetical protein
LGQGFITVLVQLHRNIDVLVQLHQKVTVLHTLRLCEMQTGGRGEQGVKEMLSCRSVKYNTLACADCCTCCRTFICRPKAMICARTLVHRSCIPLPAFAVTSQHDAVPSNLPHWVGVSSHTWSWDCLKVEQSCACTAALDAKSFPSSLSSLL